MRTIKKCQKYSYTIKLALKMWTICSVVYYIGWKYVRDNCRSDEVKVEVGRRCRNSLLKREASQNPLTQEFQT